jgi:NAD-dependent dihydropyrimidine dehydrogenase PreA subunit
MATKIDQTKCINCRTCYEQCPEEAFGLDQADHVFVQYPQECWLCGTCQMDCPTGAISVIYEAGARPMFIDIDSEEGTTGEEAQGK